MNDLSKLLEAVVFASRKHSGQTRKGADRAPYINHTLEVTSLLASVGGVDDIDLLIAAVLHDTVEDTDATSGEIASLFGERVAGIVTEVTDDKSLPDDERKALQVEHAPSLSTDAKQLKICDKVSNIREIAANPPEGWSLERRLAYIDWGERVFAGLRGVNPALDDLFEEVARDARAQLPSV